MSDAARVLASYERAFRRVGEDVVIIRTTRAGGPVARVTARARVRGYQTDELIGPIVQGDRKVIVLAQTLTSILPLTVADKIKVRGKEVQIKGVDDNTRRVGDTLIALEIQVSG